ncbi:glycoside hydrolase family 2 TIM barrel-domain containing protein [Flaviaesturariibacter amylovorans]|uniref:Glycoside hydrolase family 2 TIM barrel-domain containing protein n=1 Tax=Flaviaesturariibacter amylovorans TaxID=1084520 RepID=A0ABP8GJU3_9BACT
MKLFPLCLLLGLATSACAQGPVKVTVRQNKGSYSLLRDGQPYYVKGAGGSAYPGRIKAYGGNSIRTWGTRGARQVLDSAQKYGLTVLLGLDVARERHGFDYNDTAAVRKQLERLRGEVLQYKDHPALLAWGIGNELNLQYTNPKVWNAVNDISKMIHALDPNHPTTTVLAGISKPVADYVKERCTDIDLLSINAYGELASLPETIARVGWTGAYLVTEWGPTGHWECLQTAWKQPIEETSSEKAAVYRSRYLYGIASDRAKCLGSYVFLWGQKQERTPTWYGLFTEKGEETEVTDAMQYLWSGRWPRNHAPHLFSMELDGRRADESIYLKPGQAYRVQAAATDPDGDRLQYRWELLPEVVKVSEGGDHEDRPKATASPFRIQHPGAVLLTVPTKPGAYRVFVYASDGKNKVATANIPFFVQDGGQPAGR